MIMILGAAHFCSTFSSVLLYLIIASKLKVVCEFKVGLGVVLPW